MYHIHNFADSTFYEIKAIGDTIDQNAGLDGVQYLKNISKNKLLNGARRVDNEYDETWLKTRANICKGLSIYSIPV